MPRRGKVPVWAASPCLPHVIRSMASGRTRPWRVTSKKVLARKWRPTFFLLPGAKKVDRHKSSQIDGLCLETPAPSTAKWRFWASKKRHSQPFFDDSARVCPQAYRSDRAGWSDRADRTDQTDRGSSLKSEGHHPRSETDFSSSPR